MFDDKSTLNLKDQNITDDDFAKLVGEIEEPEKITAIDLSWNNISDVSPIAAFTNLQELNLLNNLDITDITPLERLTNLLVLDLTGTDVENASALSGMVGLRTLKIDDTNIKDISVLENLPKLEEINASCPYESLLPLTKLPNLKKLRVDSVKDFSDLSVIGRIEPLEDLCLFQLMAKDISPLSNLENLSRLDLSSFWGGDFTPLSKLSHLKELKLNWTTNLELSSLIKCAGLEMLSLRDAYVNFESLSGLTQIRRLDLTDVHRIGEGDIENLISKLPQCEIIFE